MSSETSSECPAVIYTTVTKEDAPIGGLWSAQPFAMRHVAWVSLDDYEEVRAALQMTAGCLSSLTGNAMEEGRVITFTGADAHLGIVTLGEVLDKADRALGLAALALAFDKKNADGSTER